mgnify:CR=1 FL=1
MNKEQQKTYKALFVKAGTHKKFVKKAKSLGFTIDGFINELLIHRELHLSILEKNNA